MGKSKKDLPILSYDLATGIAELIPSTPTEKEEEKEPLKKFKVSFEERINKTIANQTKFPTDKNVFVFIIQFFNSKQHYDTKDVDNMARTILNCLKGKFYEDDGQVKIFLMIKIMEKRVPKNFAFVGVKELTDGHLHSLIKIAGLESAIVYYQTAEKNNWV